MEKKSRVLVVGGTGYIGRRLVRASLAEGHPTFVLMRPEIGLDIDKLQMLLSFKAQGARLLEASLDDHAGLIAAVKQVDVVISAMSGVHFRSHNLLLQHKLVEAIKEAGNVKRFIPSEFGMDPSRMQHALDPGRVTFDEKMELRRAIEEADIPHTYISANCFAGYFCPNLCQLGTLLPPKDKVHVYGDGNVKVIFVDEDDVATYTIRSIDDPRTLNKTIYLRPQDNILTQNEVIAKWETLSGKVLEKIQIPGDEFLASIKDMDFASQVGVGHFYHIFYEGCLTNFDIGEDGAEATLLYPEVGYTRMDEYMKRSQTCLAVSHQQPLAESMEKKGRVLIVGGTGFMGRRLVRASLAHGHPTFVLMRPEIGLDIDKLQMLLSFKAQGAGLLEASFDNHAGLVAAVMQVDVVISAMSGAHILQLQEKLVEAIKEAGNVKRFIPSEFGTDPSRMGHALAPGRVTFDEKMELRRAIEEANIPHTYISANCFAAYFCPNLCQLGTLSPPKEKVRIYGDGNVKVIFVDEDDVATYTIKSIDDPRTLNKTIYLRPKDNILSQNELIAKWEMLSGNILEKIYIPADDFLASMKDKDLFHQVAVGHFYHIFYEGCLTNFDIGEDGAEATLLYPEVEYTHAKNLQPRHRLPATS
ncbi:hypothetical protein EJB05_03194 [Eragrostis curvula]|uniref:NmrA-like domain-containing protein n=1 Tax=Eragrostis curvula TaxID=38414 RepID=A0A5J9WXU4_9POAL|nr:hypothetical protein EJB05_03194 [Eragrostis curvula]